jgi:phosphoadenosine phosphosulfate reductase
MSNSDSTGALATIARAPRLSTGDPGRAQRLAEARTIVARTVDTFPGHVALSVSFGGASGMALLDLALQVDRSIRVFFVDTELLFPETYALVRRVEERYGINVEAVKPRLTVAQQNAVRGDALWARDPDACCAARKVEPLHRYLADVDAWMTGVRREQSSTRSALPITGWNEANTVVKVAPLADWTRDDVWAYVAEHDVPVNTLLHEGYQSIGCTHCTVRTAPGDDERAGRWAGFAKTECGIHAG